MSSLMLLVAFAMEWGWWAVPATLAAGVGFYYWYSRTAPSRGAAPGEFLSVGEANQALSRGEKLLFADVRSDSSYQASATTVHGAVRLHPGHPLDDARRLALKPEVRIVTFCA